MAAVLESTLPAPGVRDWLERAQVPYRVLSRGPAATLCQAADACGVPREHLARAVVLMDAKGLIMAVLPAGHLLDFQALGRLLQRDLEPVPATRLAGLLEDCEPGSCPPLPGLWRMEAVVDESLLALDTVVFEPGTRRVLVAVSGADFRRLLGDARSAGFARPVDALEVPRADPDAGSFLRDAVAHFIPARVQHALEEIHELPALPDSARCLLQLARDPRAGARELAAVIERDAALASQVLRYANSPLYGHSGRIANLQSAIARVLGFDFVLHLALGISVGRSLRVPADGPLGLNAYWRDSLHCARLVERLALAMPRSLQPRRGTVYLAGLLHNLGTLVLGQAFQAEFFLLNRYLQVNPHLPARLVERYVLGASHEHAGAWLLQSWSLPEELVAAAAHHHDPDYWGRHAVYPQLVLLADRLLRGHGMGDADSTGLPGFTLEILGLDAGRVRTEAASLLQDGGELDAIASRFAA